jgi:hypothetical protein
MNGLTTRPPVLLSLLTIAVVGRLATRRTTGGRPRLRAVGRLPGDRVTDVPGSPLSRRDALRVVGLGSLAGALTTGLLTGCDLDPGSSSKPAAATGPDPDQHIVDAARGELRDLLSGLSPIGSTAPLVAAHRLQLAALDGHPRRHSRRGSAWPTAHAVVRERRAAERFTHWAVTCQNGDLARVLASVAAGIRMQPLLQPASVRSRPS